GVACGAAAAGLVRPVCEPAGGGPGGRAADSSRRSRSYRARAGGSGAVGQAAQRAAERAPVRRGALPGVDVFSRSSAGAAEPAHLVRKGSGGNLAPRRGESLRTRAAVVRGRPKMKGSQATYALEFEKPLLELEQKLAELKRHAATGTAAGAAETLDGEIRRLERRCAKLQEEIFHDLSRWQVVQLSRHPNRPYMLDYVQRLFTDWVELHGDRSFGDDQALIGGLARFDGEPVMLIGQQKGRSTKENIARSFGMPRPEGYRKALRLMKLAERFGRPVIAFIDTPGAYPGIDAEERGQA